MRKLPRNLLQDTTLNRIDIGMRELHCLIVRLEQEWNPTMARESIRALVTTVWQAGGPDEQTLALAAALRQILEKRRLTAKSPREQLLISNLYYELEQGLGNREMALKLARRAEILSRRGGTAMERIRAVFQVAKALLYVDRIADAVRWTQQGLSLGDQFEQATGHDLSDEDRKELRYLLADQESRQVNRMAVLGGMNAEVDHAVKSAMARLEKLDNPSSMAAGLGMLVEARVLQGRWKEAIRLAAKALAAVGYPHKKNPGIAYALCFGALAQCHLGDARTALTWTADAASISQKVGNRECVLEARTVHAVARATLGRLEDALKEIDEVVRETGILHMGVLTHWVVVQQAWIRMLASVPAPEQELKKACRYFTKHGYRVMAAEALYAMGCALRLTGRNGRKEMSEASAQFKRLGMEWHYQIARREMLPFHQVKRSHRRSPFPLTSAAHS